MFAIIQTGGKQYKVAVGQKVKIEKLTVADGDAVIFDKILLMADGDKVQIGQPYLSGAKVEGKVLKQGRHDKVIVFKYHSKTRQKKKKGHRQPFTEVEIVKIS
ncbi:MAG: 50S ribosomal protein L21 [bacterium]|nr:50S ribosomal protein L21 [bacterium]